MKKSVLFCGMLLALTLVSCTGQAQPGGSNTQVEKPAAPGVSAPVDRNPTAAELGRTESTNLIASGEEVPAALQIRQGYSLYVPKEGWWLDKEGPEDGFAYEDCWESIQRDDVELCVRCYTGVTREEAQSRFLRDKNDYLFEDLMGEELFGWDERDGEYLTFYMEERGDCVYVVYWEYPAQEERWGGLLAEMAHSVQFS